MPAHLIRELLSYLPQNNRDDAPRGDTDDPADRQDPELDTIVPAASNQPYDIKDVIRRVADHGNFFEVHEHWARNIVIGFVRMDGRSVGVVANQPAYLAGCLDIDSSTKGARFVRFCDAFNIPILTFEDVPGFLPGTAQEFGGIIRHGAKLLLRVRRSHRAQDHRDHAQSLRRRVLRDGFQAPAHRRELAWPTAEIAVMGAEGAVNIVYRREIASAENPDAVRTAKLDEFRERFANPFIAAENGFVDDVIEPRQTRPRVIRALRMLETKVDTMPRKKHGNIPL